MDAKKKQTKATSKKSVQSKQQTPKPQQKNQKPQDLTPISELKKVPSI
jgi:hypothetical protein